jgi:hypothetical protein
VARSAVEQAPGAIVPRAVRPARGRGRTVAAVPVTASHWRRRLAVVYDIDGPHVRLGLAWFAANVVAMVLGPDAVAVLYAGVALAAAAQTCWAWRRHALRPDRPVAVLGAAALPLAATLGTAVLGVALVGLAAVAYYAALRRPGRARTPLDRAGMTLQAALFSGFAAACVVEAVRFDMGGAVTLVLVAAAYEVGDYLVGSGAGNPYEGPIAGVAGVAVVAFIVSILQVAPFNGNAWLFGVLAAVLCPAGQLLASAILPAAAAKAPALRRLDSLLLLAPVWAWAVGVLTH